MKKTILMTAFAGAILSGCNNHEPHPGPPETVHCKVTHKFHFGLGDPDTTNYCEYISVDTANVMISSYLNSINYQQNDTDLYSLDYNADSLRAYLANPKVVNVKFMLAHTMDYIDQGGKDQYAGYQSGALTFVIAGYDVQGNYVFYYYPKSSTAMVKDHCEPCPYKCPSVGPAAGNFIQNISGNNNGHK